MTGSIPDPLKAVRQSIEEADGLLLRVVSSEEQRDASAPALPGAEAFSGLSAPLQGKLNEELEHGVPLRHVGANEIHDSSKPRIEEGVHIAPSPLPGLLSEVKAAGGHSAVVHELKAAAAAGGPALAHVTTADKAAAAIPPDVKLRTWPKDQLLAEIKEAGAGDSPAKHLRHVEGAADRSAPVIEPDVKVCADNRHAALMAEVVSASATGLKHLPAEAVHDTSSPHVMRTAALRVTPQSPTH